MPIFVDTEGLTDFKRFFETFPTRAAKALSLAINDTMRSEVLPLAKKTILAEVNLPAGYLDGDNRLDIAQFATPTQIVGVVRGKDRPISLARFATSEVDEQTSAKGAKRGTGRFIRRVTGVRVNADGPVKALPNAFLIDLKRGSEFGGNTGLAIRLRPGETLHAVDRTNPIEIFPNVYILYGPSVDQIFSAVAKDISPQVLDYLDTEFNRQFLRLGTDNG